MNKNPELRGQLVPARTLSYIAKTALDLRNVLTKTLSIEDHFLPLGKITAHLLNLPDPTILINVVSDDSLQEGTNAIATPHNKEIALKESVFDLLVEEDPYCREIMAHELGHLILEHGVGYRHSKDNRPSTKNEDSEWQADAFAAFLLIGISIPYHLKDYSKLLGVTSEMLKMYELLVNELKLEHQNDK